MLPTYDSLDSVAIEAQFHVRHVPSESGERGVRPAQMIYYVEVASAVYGLTVNLDLDGIGKTSLVKVEDALASEPGERTRRIKASLMALAALFVGEGFGAKLSRFLPIKQVKSMVAALSSPIAFTVSPPQLSTYIEDTASRASAFKEMLDKLGISSEISLIAYADKVPQGVDQASSPEDLFKRLIEKVVK